MSNLCQSLHSPLCSSRSKTGTTPALEVAISPLGPVKQGDGPQRQDPPAF